MAWGTLLDSPDRAAILGFDNRALNCNPGFNRCTVILDVQYHDRDVVPDCAVRVQTAFKRHWKRGRSLDILLVVVFREWFESGDYRGCAFINAVVELEGSLPEVADIATRHKDEVAEVIAGLLPETKDCRGVAQAVAVALDGAIMRAQMERTAGPSLAALETILRALLKDKGKGPGHRYVQKYSQVEILSDVPNKIPEAQHRLAE